MENQVTEEGKQMMETEIRKFNIFWKKNNFILSQSYPNRWIWVVCWQKVGKLNGKSKFVDHLFIHVFSMGMLRATCCSEQLNNMQGSKGK